MTTNRNLKSLQINLDKAFYDTAVALQDIDFELEAGDILTVIGPNGSGKSTLLKCLGGMLNYTGTISAEFSVVDHSLAAEKADHKTDWQELLKQLPRRELFSYMPQRENTDLNFPLTIRELIQMASDTRHPPQAGLLEEILKELDLQPLLDKAINQVSGGQLQRAFLARTLLIDAPLILLDEPDNAIDITTQQQFAQVLRQQSAQGKICILSTHDLNFAQITSNKTLFLNKTQISFGATSTECNEKNLLKTFGPKLIHTHQDEHIIIQSGHQHGH